MKKLFVLVIALLVIGVPALAQTEVLVNGDFSTGDETGWTRWNSPWGGGFNWDATQGFGSLSVSNGSFGWYQAINSIDGATYTITGNWMGNGNTNWVEVLFFNDDGREIYKQCDDPTNAAVISKVDGWGMNGGMPFKKVGSGADYGSITDFYYPSGLKTNTITGTGGTIYVVLKTGASNGSTLAYFDDFSVIETPVPEPASILALVAGLGGLIIRRKR